MGGCRGRRGYTHLAATCESYGEGDEFWTSSLMAKRETEEQKIRLIDRVRQVLTRGQTIRTARVGPQMPNAWQSCRE